MHPGLVKANRYRDQLCCFNDDIQGTAAVAVGTLLSACRVKQQKLSQQTIVFAGAGSAGCGIAEQIIRQMQAEGLSEADARARIFMVDRQGLLGKSMAQLPDFQQQLAHSDVDLAALNVKAGDDLQLVVAAVKPTVLIGVSGQAGLFDETLIRTMLQHCPQPIIFPLSNPSKQIEAQPADILQWTDGQALVATGSPFQPVTVNGRQYPIAQCNNSYIFPGLGLAVVAAKISRLPDSLLMIASDILAEAAQQSSANGLLPPLTESRTISEKIAFAVARQAIKEGLAPAKTDDELRQAIADNFWEPAYRQYRRVSL